MISGLIGGVKLGQIKKLPSEPPQALGMFMETCTWDGLLEGSRTHISVVSLYSEVSGVELINAKECVAMANCIKVHYFSNSERCRVFFDDI